MAKDTKVKQFEAGSCYSYIVTSQGQAIIIDPHISLKKVYENYLSKERSQLIYIIDTHTHADHFSLAAMLKKGSKAPVLMHEKAVSQVADKRLRDGDEVSVGDAKFRVIYAPGHTDDSISLFGEGRIFTGDVLLIGSVGRTDFQNGSPESMFDTLQKIKALPEETAVFPAHDYNEKHSSAIGVEKAANPFLQINDRGAFTARMRAKMLPKPFNIDNIIRVNQRGEVASIEMINPAKAAELIQKNANIKLLDVRSVTEFSQVHINGAINIPIDVLVHRLEELSGAGAAYIVMCRTGNRSPMAADMLMQAGIKSVKVMDGGMIAWQKAGLPVVRGEGGISLERQVRTIAGTLVLAGALLAIFASPFFIAIPLFVGCGLLYAGITDNCLTGMLLMKLPYNKKLYRTKLGGGTCSISQ